MARLIDAEALKKELGDTNMDIYTNEVKEMIDQQPTVEQKNGHWIMEKDWEDGDADYKCSSCEYDETYRKDFPEHFYKYCPHCGAKMDEVTE